MKPEKAKQQERDKLLTELVSNLRKHVPVVANAVNNYLKIKI